MKTRSKRILPGLLMLAVCALAPVSALSQCAVPTFRAAMDFDAGTGRLRSLPGISTPMAERTSSSQAPSSSSWETATACQQGPSWPPQIYLPTLVLAISTATGKWIWRSCTVSSAPPVSPSISATDQAVWATHQFSDHYLGLPGCC